MSKKEFSPEVQAVSDAVRAGIAIDNAGKAVQEDGLWLNNMQPNVTEEMCRHVKHNTEVFAAGLLHGFGMNGIDVMAANPDLNKIELFVPTMGRDGFDLELNRTRESRNPRNGETITKYGVADVVLRTAADNKGAGELKIARAFLSEYATDKLVS